MQHQPPPSNHAITTEQIQKCLDDNKNLIMAIMENQNLGKFQECAQYQALLQNNLMYLAAIADAQPPTSNPSQVMQQANIFTHQPQPTTPQQPGGSGSHGGGQKPPLQLNSLRTQDQQPQRLQFQQQQLQLQAQMGIKPGGL